MPQSRRHEGLNFKERNEIRELEAKKHMLHHYMLCNCLFESDSNSDSEEELQ